ncbi:lactate dehydrogenase [Clostridium fessum]|uniref:lactate dehydrogenase n=1 Tax=Clostridium fessum TaxID=2126740 RepID=UPI0022E704CB|nr:lactate dehydrogenase [Clostridium fessum]
MYYYIIGDKICCSFNGNLSYERAEMPHPGTPLTFLFEREPGTGRESFKVNSPLLLFQEAENVSWLSSRKLEAQAETMKKKLAESTEKAAGSGASESGAPAKMNCELDEAVKAAIDQGMMRAVNRLHPDFETILAEKPQKTKKRVHVLAIGDVGSTLLTGLHLLGGDCISSIGICDISDKVTARWEFEENQIAYPWAYDALPEVDVVKPEDLFKCDVFVFVASKGIPPVGSGVKDVRMYQFENNSKIVAQYARQARAEHFKGLFAVVSDPVDPLAKTAWLESNKDENGILDLKGLRPEQVQGFGLGVMNARAAYYAKRDGRFSQFLTEGRSFGPHGQDLVIADSIANYNDELSKELTQLTVTANLHMRAIGFKPFIAPAYSSGAISLILMMRGEWHCGSVFMGGIFMGVKNRYTEYGLETEILPLPDALYERIVTAEENLKKIV